METPPTPLHPAPNAEVSNLPSEPLSNSNMELNPDLYDEEDDDNSMAEPQRNTEAQEDNAEDNDPDSSGIYINLWTMPFDDAYDLLKAQFLKNWNQPKVTEAQQSKFVNYLDHELLQVQRKFIKNQADTAELYSLQQLLHDIGTILDLIWFLVNPNNKLYGQEEYFLRIIGDLEDWVAYYGLPIYDAADTSSAELYKFFNFFQAFDTRLSFLIDGYQVNGETAKLSSTEIVRLVPIVSRLRLEIVSKLDPSRSKLTRAKTLGNEQANDLLNILDVEIGRLFEGILERQ